jgi:protein SCO1/2
MGSRRPIAILAILALLAGACSGTRVSQEDLMGVAMAEPTPKPDFTLTDTEGESFHFASETEGRLTLLYFGYTYCPDICPVHLAQIAEALEQVPQVSATVVFVSVDPDRDTPERMREFLDNFDPGFVGVTGTPEEIRAAEDAVGVPPSVKEGGGDDYTVGHAGQVFAWAPDGLLYAQYPFGTRQSTWVNDLEMLSRIQPEDA